MNKSFENHLINLREDSLHHKTENDNNLFIKGLNTKLSELEVPPNECAYDPEAFVFNKGINSESELCSLIKAAIASSNKHAILTSYAIKPINPSGIISITMRAILEGISDRQEDPNLTVCFLYNKSQWIQNLIVGKNTYASQKSTPQRPSEWLKLISNYNAEESAKPNGKPIKNLRCRFVLVGAKADSFWGSQHNKFIINDNGFAATTGSSISNKNKPNWFDGGAMLMSKLLANSQRDYFVNVLLPHGVALSELAVDSNGKPSLIPTSIPKVRQLLDSPIADPSYECDAHTAIFKTLSQNNLPLDGMNTGVTWLQNKGSGDLLKVSKPIGIGFEYLFDMAKSGDTICLRNNFVQLTSYVQSLILKVLERGVNVRIFEGKIPSRTETKTLKLLLRRKNLKDLFESVAGREKKPNYGTLEYREMDLKRDVWDLYNFNDQNIGIADHAKVYILRNDKQAHVMVGTYNLEGQSFKRSNENTLIVNNHEALARSLFDDLWEASPKLAYDKEHQTFQIVDESKENNKITEIANKKPLPHRNENKLNPEVSTSQIQRLNQRIPSQEKLIEQAQRMTLKSDPKCKRELFGYGKD